MKKTTEKTENAAVEKKDEPVVMRVRLTFIDDILGTAPADAEIYKTFVAGKAPDALTLAEEVDAHGVDEVVEKGMTIFTKDKDGNPVLWNYQIKGFFKSACQALRTVRGRKSEKLKAFKKEIDMRIFVYADVKDKANRMIPIQVAGEIGNCQRPLRAQTMQGERVALANSESIPAGSSIEFDIYMLQPSDKPIVEEWLSFGELNGLGQWRNSGKGAFIWEEVKKTA